MPSGIDIDIPADDTPALSDGSIKSEFSTSGDQKDITDAVGSDGAGNAMDEGVEVVLDAKGSTKVVDRNPSPDQNVFRHPQAVRPRPMRAPPSSGPPPPPPPPHHHQYRSHPPYLHYPYGHHGSGSWGYGPPPPHPDMYRGHPPPPPHPLAPYPVPPYQSSSSSFDEQYHHHTPHYSPHIQYPGPRYPTNEEVNVISPNHKGDPHYRPPITPRSRSAAPVYQYPPTSPVSRPGQSPPRLRSYAVRRGGSEPYALSQRTEYDDGQWHGYGPPPPPPSSASISSNRGAKAGGRPHPPVVAESFDSAPPSRPPPSAHNTPMSIASSSNGNKPPLAPQSSDPHMQFYGGGGSWGSFDSAAGAGPPPHFDDHRYYGFPPDSPYSLYPPPHSQPYTSPGQIYTADSFSSPHPAYGPPPLPPTFTYSYDDEEERLIHEHHADQEGNHKYVTPPGASTKKNRSKNSTPVSSNISHRNSLLPKAAEEIDFEVADPPLEPIIPENDTDALCDSLADVNVFDVLCGRGGGTNSQIGNRRFRQLVQDFQPIYLLAKRKEKPLLARTIVLIIRKRGGRFLKKNEESGELFEVGDIKAEAKTSQALREGLDVRATKSAANAITKKDKKKGGIKSPTSDSPRSTDKETSRPHSPESPPTLPRLQGDEVESNGGIVHPHSPEPNTIRKRRRVRSAERFFNDFMPPRAEINRGGEDDDGHDDDDINTTPIRRNGTRDEDDYQDCGIGMSGCAGIALDIVTGAAKGSFCLGPTGWRR